MDETQAGCPGRARGDGLEAEKAFQASRAPSASDVRPTPAYVFERYERTPNWRLIPKECLFRLLGDVRGKRVLDFGCGEGVVTTQLAWLGARVTGVDISEDLVAAARRRAELDGVAHRVDFRVGDIMEMSVQEGVFDLLVCSAVLHHVELRRVFPRLLELVKSGGRVAILEPVALSDTLQRIRDALPVEKHVSPGERQLGGEDIRFLASRLGRPEVRYYRIFERLSRFLPHRNEIDRGHPLTKYTMLTLAGLDRLAMTMFPPARRWAGTVVIRGTAP